MTWFHLCTTLFLHSLRFTSNANLAEQDVPATHTQNLFLGIQILARNIFDYFNLLKFSAILWEMTNPRTAYRLTAL